MDKDKFLEKIAEIGTCEDEVNRRTLLTDLSDEIVGVFDDLETSNTKIESLNEEISKNKEDMDKLREANMSLFLKVSSNKSEQEINEGTTGIKQPEVHKRKFEDLFDEKGGLR